MRQRHTQRQQLHHLLISSSVHLFLLRHTTDACENDHEAVRALASTLMGRVKVVNCMVDRVSVRRDIELCHNEDGDDEDGDDDCDAEAAMDSTRSPHAALRVIAEEWGGTLVALDTRLNRDFSRAPVLRRSLLAPAGQPATTTKKKKPLRKLPFASASSAYSSGAEVITPTTDEAALYLAERKLALVNGMHTTL